MKSHTLKSLISLSALLCAFVSSFADPDSFTVSCSNGNVFTISRTDASAASWVEYYTQSGSAVAGIHYEDVAGRLDFAAGESSKIVTVPLYSVASIDKYNLSGSSRQFYFCIHNNSMTSTPRATGSWNDATVISASDISVTSQQTICPGFSIGQSQVDHVFSERNFICKDAIGDALTNSQKSYYTLTNQAAKYDFNIELTYNYTYDHDSYPQAVGITLDGNSNELGVVRYGSRYYYIESKITPTGLDQNLFHSYYSVRITDRYGQRIVTIPTTSIYPYDMDYIFNSHYESHYSDGWFVDMDPTKHIGIRILSSGGKFSDIIANVRLQDKTAPVVTGISTNVSRIYTSGERLYVAVHFNEPVTGSVPSASVSIGSRSFTFNYACGNNTNTLVFYSDLTTTSASGITGTVKVTGINGTVTDACGNAASVSSISANNSVPNFKMYPTYAVSLNPNGGTIIDGNFSRYTYSVGATLPTNIEKTGHNFDGWYTNESLTGSPVTEIYPTDMGNKTFYAKWSPKNFKVTLVGNGAELSSDIDVTTHVYGIALQLPVLEKPGYTFYGWYPNAELTGDPVYSIGATDMGDKTFYAKWTTNTYYIAYNPAGADDSEAMPNSACTYDAESPLAANTYSRMGYEFLGWATAAQASSITYTDGQTVKNLTDVNSEVVELFAVWKPNTYTVTFSQGEPTTLGTASIEATYDAPLQVVICPDSVGYAFGGYFTEENGGGVQYYTYEGKSAVARYKNTSDITLYAFWTVRDYVISFNNNGGTITTADYATSYHYGTEVTLPAIEKDGCTFGGWFANVNCTGTAVTKIASSEYGDKTFYAKWNPITYNISLHENGGTIITGNVANYTFGVGTVLPSYSNMERDGHMFAGWYDNELCEGDAVSMVSVAEFGDKEFWAKWEENGYFVTLHTNGGTINSGNVVLYKYGKRTELPSNVTKTGYDFAGWYDNSSFIGSPVTEITKTDLGDKNYWAKWKEKVYSITFNTKGGDINNVAIENYTYTVGVVLPADVTLKGHTFKGWYDNEACLGNPVTLISTTDFGEKEFWADWTENKYSISYIANGGIINDNYVEEYTYGASEITLPQDVIKPGYTFGGWYTNDSYTSPEVKVITVTDLGNKTFYAKWNVNTYNVTLVANGGTINSGNIANYTYGYGVTLTSDITQNAFTFAGWYADEKFETARLTRISETKTGDLTLYAKWTKNNYLITLNVNEGSIDEEYVSIYTFGEGTTLPTNVSRKGYTFKGWYTNSNFDGSAIRTVSATEYGNKTFWAKWLVNTYKVTFDAKGGVIHSGGFDSYIYGVGASLPTNVTKTGYTFDGWYLDEDCNIASPSVISVNETGDKTFYAKWNVNTYNVIFVTNEGVINSGNVESYEFGKGATLPTDVTKEGYSFGGWFTNSSYLGSSVQSISSTEAGDKTFYAKWTKTSYEVSINYDKAMGTISSAESYQHGDNAVLKAHADGGFEFAFWSCDDENVLKDKNIQDSTLTLVITKPVSLQATFKVKEVVYSLGNLQIDTLKTETEIQPIDLTTLFATSENGEISYLIANSSPNVVLAQIEDNKLYLSPLGIQGKSTITITAKLANGNKTSLSSEVVVEYNCDIQVESTITNASCYGTSDGQILLSSETEYSYQWVGKDNTTKILENIKAGNYSVQITDERGCKVLETYTVTQPDSIYVSIDTVINPRCNVASEIRLNADGEYTYMWSDGSTEKNLVGAEIGEYSVVVTNPETGCSTTLKQNLELTFKQPQISLVTVSKEKGKNLIVWVRESTDQIAYYTIYREDSEANEFNAVGTLNYSEISVFEDEEADPMARQWSYKISATDVCGNETALSNAHTTLHLNEMKDIRDGKAALIWEPYKGLEYSSFYIIRETTVGTFTFIDTLSTVPSTLTSYTAEFPSVGKSVYYVGVKMDKIIDPKDFQKAESGPFAIAISNIAEAENQDIPDAIESVENAVAVYAINHTIFVNNADSKTVEVYEIGGKKVASVNGSETTEITVARDGVYLVVVDGKSTKVLVK